MRTAVKEAGGHNRWRRVGEAKAFFGMDCRELRKLIILKIT